jgi:S1-C subfamily serine protease
MNKAHILLGLALAGLVAAAHSADAPAPRSREQIDKQLQDAQSRLDQAAHEVAELSMQLSNQSSFDMQPWMRHSSPRAILGINIGMSLPSSPPSNEGVRIVSVSPGGPADVAGLKANDVIVTFGGKDLRSDAGHSPNQTLLALMFEAKVGEAVAVEYKRDGQLRKALVVPKNFPTFLSESDERELQGLGETLHELMPAMKQRDPSGFGSAELLKLSPTLGRYFGTDKGLLVVRAPQDARLNLQDGDVILDVDGRVPTGASHALQILNSYRTGEKLKLHIMRQQKHVELLVEIPPDLTRAERYRFAPASLVDGMIHRYPAASVRSSDECKSEAKDTRVATARL